MRRLVLLVVLVGCKKSDCQAAVDEAITDLANVPGFDDTCRNESEESLSCIVRARTYENAMACRANSDVAGVHAAPSKVRLCDEAATRIRELARDGVDRALMIALCEDKGGTVAPGCIRNASSPTAIRACVNR